MFKDAQAFSSFSVNDLAAAKEFYGTTLGLDIVEQPEGLLLKLAGGGRVFIYPKTDHQPAAFTVLNFHVAGIEKAVDDLSAIGVGFERYEGQIKTDESGIFWGKKHENGPNIAWFKDPAGNILSVIEE